MGREDIKNVYDLIAKERGRNKDDCDHLHMDGVANKNLLYRLLIPLLADLINTKYFITTSLNFQNDCIGSDSENAYTDILDGEVTKEYLHGMDNNYKAWPDENIGDRVNTVPVNLLFMDFYHGAQLFHWKTCEFWCYLTSIDNLTPAYRGKIGI